jgi:hypothetical protein
MMILLALCGGLSALVVSALNFNGCEEYRATQLWKAFVSAAPAAGVVQVAADNKTYIGRTDNIPGEQLEAICENFKVIIRTSSPQTAEAAQAIKSAIGGEILDPWLVIV